MSQLDRPAFMAGGDISPCRFVKVDPATTTGLAVIQCTANTDKPIGISQEGTKAAPVDGASTLAASAGLGLRVFLVGETALLQCGGNITAGDAIMSHTDGTGVTATGSNIVGAIALQSGVAGEKIKVWPTSPHPLS